jgi:hypothetical protein
MDLAADDIRVLELGERMRPSCLWPRPADKSRKRVMYYWIEDIGNGMTPLATGCDYDDRDGALAWALTYLSRKIDNALARLGPEEIRVVDLLDKYVAMVKRQLAMGQITRGTKIGYCAGVERLKQCFAAATVADVVAGGRERYYDWGAERGQAANSLMEDANTLKRAINWTLEAAGSAFRVSYWVGLRKPAARVALDPDEYTRVLNVLENHVRYDENLQIVMVRDRTTDEERPWRAPPAVQRARVPFQRAFPMIIDTGTRNAVALRTTWTGARTETGVKSPHLDPDSGIYIRNPVLQPETPEKQKGLCVASPQFQTESGEWMDEDLDAGIEYVVHDWRGRPVKALSAQVWATLLKHARVRHRKFYSTKHTAVTIGFTEGVPVQKLSQRFAVTGDVLMGTYALQDDPANQIDAAIAQGDKAKWFASHAVMKQREARAAAAREARQARHAANPPPKPKKGMRLPPPPPGKSAPRVPPTALARSPTPRGSKLHAATLRTRCALPAAPTTPPSAKEPTEK